MAYAIPFCFWIGLCLALSQITDFLSFVGHFFVPPGEKDLQKKASTMLPQAKAMFCVSHAHTSKVLIDSSIKFGYNPN
jgi:hypothetical protein